ncbi:hypothetical protein K491DRAFT_782427 [Lophiostoma macrostomum CBS 122681]|uniref:MADS-box domain-containing protein n=1 Tax=Lophiostoma macrostomum CBS 122681 TaxID=1314788 RepID=A0A6A6SUD5_9PLEO|nr:hypothetical protein K491DRAFT_782427 [Lophiostoma macrostomum CBS 122681]
MASSEPSCVDSAVSASSTERSRFSTPSSPPRLNLEPLPPPRIRTTPPTCLAPPPSLIRKRPAKFVRMRQQQLYDILQRVDEVAPESSIANDALRRHSSLESFPFSPPIHCTPEPQDRARSTYHVHDGTGKANRIHSQDPRVCRRTDTVFRKAKQLAELANTEVYLVVRHPGQCMVFDSANPLSPSLLEPKDNETIITVHVS